MSSSNLAPGQSAIVNATYSTTQSDVDNGSVVNTATSSCIFIITTQYQTQLL